MQITELILNTRQKRKFRGPRLVRKTGIDFHKLAKVRRAIVDDIELDEAANVHLNHFEDKVLHGGYNGAEEALNIAYALYDMLEGHAKSPMNITTKWDGSPALLVGRDATTGKFVMGDKGIFAKTGARIMDTPDAIDANKQGEEKSSLRGKLKEALTELPKIFPPNFKGLLQGDLLFVSGTKESMTIDDEEHITFTPNTLTYAVPTNSDIGKTIENAKVGIVFHTSYPDWPASNDPKYGASVDDLNETSTVWFRDAAIHDVSGQVTLTLDESTQILRAINNAKKSLIETGEKFFDFLGTDAFGKEFSKQLEATINASIKQQGAIPTDATSFASSFISRFEDKTETAIANYKKQDSIDNKTQELEKGLQFFEANREKFIQLYNLWYLLFSVKSLFAKKLNGIRAMDTFEIMDDGTVEVRDPEGFVAVDHIGNALKIVDRLGFSAANFKKTY
jgi:hypothetical protein